MLGCVVGCLDGCLSRDGSGSGGFVWVIVLVSRTSYWSDGFVGGFLLRWLL